jgi:hypothetical protein
MELYFAQHNNKEGNEEQDNFNMEEYIANLTEAFIASSTNATPPASKFAIKNLEVVWIDENHILEDLSCPICMDPFEISTKSLQFPCKHLFHEDCLVEWLQKVKIFKIKISMQIVHYVDMKLKQMILNLKKKN